MSDQNIKVGDYVEVVKWECCGCRLGRKYVVAEVSEPLRELVGVCSKCNTYMVIAGWRICSSVSAICAPMHWLRKLPDLTEGETTETVVFDKTPETVK